jgi:serine kinase of HPr protein (carbohydrate metabolism regulator)
MILLHASCVAIGEAGVLLRGPSGSGKSDLALRLIDDGAALVADDYCEVSAIGTDLMVSPPRTIAGKLEIRGYGIVTRPFVARARAVLLVDLAAGRDVARLPDPEHSVIDGVSVRRMALDPFIASATARVRAAASDALQSVVKRQERFGS